MVPEDGARKGGRLGYGTRAARYRKLGQARLVASRVVQKVSKFTRAGGGLVLSYSAEAGEERYGML